MKENATNKKETILLKKTDKFKIKTGKSKDFAHNKTIKGNK